MGCAVSAPEKFDTAMAPTASVVTPEYRSTKKPYLPTYIVHRYNLRIAIVGSTHAGTVAAAVLRNGSPDLRISVFERNNTVSFLSCGIHLAVMGYCTDLNRMFYNSVENLRTLNIDVYAHTDVNYIDFGTKRLFYKDLYSGVIGSYEYDKLILASGSVPAVPRFFYNYNERVLMCKNYEHARRLYQLKFERVGVLGAGHIGCEMAFALAVAKSDVFLIDYSHRILQKYFDEYYTEILEDEFKSHGVHIMTGYDIEEVICSSNGVHIKQSTFEYDVDYVILAAGFLPNTAYFLENSPEYQLNNLFGAISVNERYETSLIDVYAVGDCCTIHNNVLNRETYFPLATHAIRYAAVAAYQILGKKDIVMCGTQGSFGIYLFDYALACTGLSNEEAARLGLENICKIIFSDDISIDFAAYSTDCASVTLIYNEETNVIVGCYVMGTRDHTGIVDFMSVCINHHMTVYDVLMSEMCYNPHFGSIFNLLYRCCCAVLMEVPEFKEETS